MDLSQHQYYDPSRSLPPHSVTFVYDVTQRLTITAPQSLQILTKTDTYKISTTMSISHRKNKEFPSPRHTFPRVYAYSLSCLTSHAEYLPGYPDRCTAFTWGIHLSDGPSFSRRVSDQFGAAVCDTQEYVARSMKQTSTKYRAPPCNSLK